jgi:hypothetical protein
MTMGPWMPTLDEMVDRRFRKAPGIALWRVGSLTRPDPLSRRQVKVIARHLAGICLRLKVSRCIRGRHQAFGHGQAPSYGVMVLILRASMVVTARLRRTGDAEQEWR